MLALTSIFWVAIDQVAQFNRMDNRLRDHQMVKNVLEKTSSTTWEDFITWSLWYRNKRFSAELKTSLVVELCWEICCHWQNLQLPYYKAKFHLQLCMVYVATCHVASLLSVFFCNWHYIWNSSSVSQTRDIDIVVERAHIYSPWLLALGDTTTAFWPIVCYYYCFCDIA